jgi:NADPH:quinone reductase-like Zn-dependent oxidoreductase
MNDCSRKEPAGKAIVITAPGGPEVLAVRDLPDPVPGPWTSLVAIPEVYGTAWSALFGNLDLRAGQTVLVRGATSALGQAAVNIAAGAGELPEAHRIMEAGTAGGKMVATLD